MRIFLLNSLFTAFIAFNSYSQIDFEKGYYVDNNGQKTTCLIKNVDWMKNPTEFKYKFSEGEDAKTLTIENVKEFGVDKESRYIKSSVDLDTSVDEVKKLSRVREPIFIKRELFLKVLVEGKATLFLYENSNGRKYFYKTEVTEIKPLIYKKYIKGVNTIAENNQYKQQLWNDLNDDGLLQKKILKINYRENDLIGIFNAYNGKIKPVLKNEKNDWFNLSVRPGVNSSIVKSSQTGNVFNRTQEINFDRELSFRIGVEIEMILPFNKNKWAILAEPFYNSYKTEQEQGYGRINMVDYNYIGLGIGLRHYIFLNKKSKLFMNGSMVLAMSTADSNVVSFGQYQDIDNSTTAAFGIGYTYNNKFSAELRYNLNREILKYIYTSAQYSGQSIILGYKLF
ncbi:hypothetical protein LCGC14_0079520 [marine sediment metagenome]|uniref:Outer membrane protein beta-barrel domain-containing protein n=1 Tax=marine sediment metagenome TaxID=412755 RepID=A0A0F9Y038_9ZZZZ|nr:tRNA modification GTPase [Maribacter sp.]HDZ04546.1 tRNA modification GTPase [Maribacter sp.]HEA81327.1 tRNA modification GTPase [Maribacter sp.]